MMIREKDARGRALLHFASYAGNREINVFSLGFLVRKVYILLACAGGYFCSNMLFRRCLLR